MTDNGLIEERLILVSKFHMVLGIFSLVISVLMGVGAVIGFLKGNEPADVQIVLNIISFAGVAGSLLLSGGIIYVSRLVRKRKNHALCFVVSCLMLPALPFGTAVGAYSLYVLLDDEVKKTFQNASSTKKINSR